MLAVDRDEDIVGYEVLTGMLIGFEVAYGLYSGVDYFVASGALAAMLVGVFFQLGDVVGSGE